MDHITPSFGLNWKYFLIVYHELFIQPGVHLPVIDGDSGIPKIRFWYARLCWFDNGGGIGSPVGQAKVTRGVLGAVGVVFLAGGVREFLCCKSGLTMLSNPICKCRGFPLSCLECSFRPFGNLAWKLPPAGGVGVRGSPLQVRKCTFARCLRQ